MSEGNAMLKKIIETTAAAMLLAATVCMSASALDVVIDGEKVVFDDNYGYPFITEGRTLVPLRVTMEAYGANVRWDAEQSTAIVTLNETTVVCPTNENCIYRNGTRIPNEVGAVIIDSRTYLPIRAVLEAFDAQVGYDGNVLVTRPEYMSYVDKLEAAKPGNWNFWGEWSNAMSLFNSGKYYEAADAFEKLVPTIFKHDGPVNAAMLYNHLGFCCEKTGRGDLAAACFIREGELWDMVEGQHQSAVAARRKAKYARTVVQMFASVKDEKYNVRLNTQSEFVPKAGILKGVTLKRSSFPYIDTFEATTGVKLGAGLIYGTPAEGISPYKNVFTEAAKRGVAVQYALQPQNLADLAGISVEDSRYVAIAKDISATNAVVYVRFASEMNDTTSAIYTENYELYKEKFRIVADIFHKYAPNCAMVWSPNFSPEDTIELYYPGDAYVDIVGMSAYSEYQPETDPLDEGIDRSRFGALLNSIVSLYGYKKPIIVSECGASYRNPVTGDDITEFASRQINEFFTYLPIKYPQISSAYLFETVDAAGIRRFEFPGNATYSEAAIKGLSSYRYISDLRGDSGEYSFELGNNVRVPAANVLLHSFVETLHNDFSYVVYRINGTDIGVSYGIPYTISADFSPYKGQTAELTCLAFDSEQRLCASRKINIIVE